MGIEAKDRQDQLFGYRFNQHQLFFALALALSGNDHDRRQAEAMLADFASDPPTARAIIRAIPPEAIETSPRLGEIVSIAHRAISPRTAMVMTAS